MLRQVTLNKANRRADRSVSITFITQLEESSEGFMEIDAELSQSGTLYFKPNGSLTQQEIDEIDKADMVVEGKTMSQRLRNVLYVLCEQSGEEDFKDFYSNRMELIINQIKDKLV